MEERINVAELLKGCPKGLELYCPMYGVAYFEGIDNENGTHPIKISFDEMVEDEIMWFMDDGSLSDFGEVMLFPSKENRDWNKFLPFRINEDNVVIVMEEMKMFFEQIRQEEQRRSVMQDIEEIVDDFNKCIDSILEKLKEKK